MSQYKVLVVAENEFSEIGSYVSEHFKADVVYDIEDVPGYLQRASYKAVVYDVLAHSAVDRVKLSRLMKMDETLDLPVIVIANAHSLQDKLDAFDIGCDDFVEGTASGDEACARITKSIFHRVAADQLANRLELANQTAHSAMIDNSDLGANIQFLLNIHRCDNLDQLGQLFFSTIERYGLKCSLQLRTAYEIKNMEAHGMAKDLESQLLSQLKGSGRFVDYGARTIMNYDRISLLVKNMPVDDLEKYGAIKDNTFSLVQGMNARVVSLEEGYRLLDERETLKKLSGDVRRVMGTIQGSYQKVMRSIAGEVDSANELIQMKIPSFALTEQDESFIESTMDNCVKNTTKIFNEGLMLDEIIERLERVIQRSLDAIEEGEKNAKAAIGPDLGAKESIELF